jgi:RNA polymerase sigma factor (TIGR02999 family)
MVFIVFISSNFVCRFQKAFFAFNDTGAGRCQNPPSFFQNFSKPNWHCCLDSDKIAAMGEVTRILVKIHAGGDPLAADELLSLVHRELRIIAESKMAHEAAGHTLQATALINEAWMRLFPEGRNQKFEQRKHFFGAAAIVMRNILVDHARRKNNVKHGGGKRVDLPDSQLVEIAHPSPPDEILAVNEALKRLTAEDPASANLVNLHYFVGMTMSEAADALDISKRQAERLWTYAKAWLRREIGKDFKS